MIWPCNEPHKSPSNRVLGVPGAGSRFPKVCQQLGAWRMYLPRHGQLDPLFRQHPRSTYLAIASRNRLLYSFGLVTVGRFLPPPANPRFLIQLSSCLSHVYVRM